MTAKAMRLTSGNHRGTGRFRSPCTITTQNVPNQTSGDSRSSADICSHIMHGSHPTKRFASLATSVLSDGFNNSRVSVLQRMPTSAVLGASVSSWELPGPTGERQSRECALSDDRLKPAGFYRWRVDGVRYAVVHTCARAFCMHATCRCHLNYRVGLFRSGPRTIWICPR